MRDATSGRWLRGKLPVPWRGPSNGSPEPINGWAGGIDHESLRRLERQLLFVIGCARSGTTALARALNRSPELLLLEEPNFFANSGIEDFVGFFNRMHREWGSARMKGTYVRPPMEPETGPLPMLVRLAKEYRYVGGKIAFGPSDDGYNWPEAFFEYHARYFFHARRLVIMRTPVESIWSMHKMFPDRRLPLLFSTWLRSAETCINCYRVFPGVRWMFFDDLGVEAIGRFAATIPLEIEVPPSMLARSYVVSKLSEDELPAPLAPYAALCSGCTQIFRELRDNFCRERLCYNGPRSEWDFFDGIVTRLSGLLAECSH